MTLTNHALPLGRSIKGQIQCTLDRETALRFLGYTGQQIDDELKDRFEELAQRCETVNSARYVWTADCVCLASPHSEAAEAAQPSASACGEANLREGIALDTCGLQLPGRDCARHLEGAKYVVLAALTLGQQCEQELRQLKALNTLDFLMYDACASALTEAAGNAVHDQIAKAARQAGLYAHARFSPGYGDLPLNVQPAFLQAVGANRALGLAVNENNFLVPMKSITAIIGLFEDEECDGESPCAICAALDYCSFRERGTTCHGKRL